MRRLLSDGDAEAAAVTGSGGGLQELLAYTQVRRLMAIRRERLNGGNCLLI